MPRLSPEEYAALLCKAIKDYDFPPVTYAFDKDYDSPPVTYAFDKDNEIHHEDMFAVEQYIGTLLRSKEPQNGLLNVLYWGYARQPGRRKDRVSRFRATNPNELKPKLDQFVKLVEELTGPSINGEVPSGGSGLLKIKKLKLPQFSQVPFVSKILMFLDPTCYPVLDLKIANKVANPCFPPLQNLKFTGIPINEDNATVYDTWACWCREIATEVNKAPESPRHDVRVVDVERALFTLADSQATDNIRVLLAGPAGWTFDRKSDSSLKCPGLLGA